MKKDNTVINSLKNEIKIDDRDGKEILDEIKALSRSYTPEWRFDALQPDAASVIGILFANQMMENIRKLNQAPDKYHVEFANMYGLSCKPPIPAKTICAMRTGEGIRGGIKLAKGTQVIGTADSGEEVLFRFSSDICVINTELTDIIEASATKKRVTAYRPDADGFSPFSFQGRELHRQAVLMCFQQFPDVQKQRVRLRFRGSLPASRLAELFADSGRFAFSCFTDCIGDAASCDGRTRLFDVVKADGEFVEIGSREEIPAVNYRDGKVTALYLQNKVHIDEPIVLDSIELFAENRVPFPDFIWNEKGEVKAEQEEFCPFTERPAVYHQFLIGQSDLMRQTGAVIALDFQLDFRRCAVPEKVDTEQDLRVIKRKPKREQAHYQCECRVQEISVEYFNGKTWRHLAVSMDMTALFAKEENAGKYHITFKVPEDWEDTEQGGYEGRCIRMQVVRADNCYMQNVTYVYPVLSAVRLCLCEQGQGTYPLAVAAVQGAETVWHGGSSMRNGADIRAFMPLPYQGDYVFLGFNRPFDGEPASLFVELDEETATHDFGDCRKVSLDFSYSAHTPDSGQSAFHPSFKSLKVIDGTNALQNSGIVTFFPPADMAECELEGIRRYWLRIEDLERCFAKKSVRAPVVRRIHMNAVVAENVIEREEQDYYITSVVSGMRFPLYADNILSAQVWVNERERLSVREMDRLMADSPAEVSAEYNTLGEIEDFYVLWHEADTFDGADYQERCYCIDRSRNELVFGDGARVRIPQNTGSIAFKTRVLCCDGKKALVRAGSIDRFRSTVTAVEQITNPVDAYGAAGPEEMRDALRRGDTMLSSRGRMVTEKDYIEEALAFSDAIDQAVCITGEEGITLILLMKDFKRGSYSFRSIREPLGMHLAERCEAVCGKRAIWILQPVFVKISLDIWLHVQDIAAGMELKQQWLDKITEFLEPVKSDGRTGWQIGRLPTYRQIRLMLSALETAASVAYIGADAAYTDKKRMHRMSLDRVNVSPFMVCCNGMHTINILNE